MPLTATSYHAEMTKSAAWDLHPAGGTVMSLEIDPPFSVVYPQRPTVPCVFNSPHSGSRYPKTFLAASRLDPLTLRRSEDCHVDQLFAAAVALGAPMLKANFPRAFLDVNREPWELDPAMFDGELPTYVNSTSARVAGGLGTIPRIVCEHEEIYAGRLSFREAERRIRSYYLPYHAMLQRLMSETVAQFGVAVLVDCHSMPSSAASGPSARSSRPDIVLGDRYGSSCEADIALCLEEALTAQGLTVIRNKPYAGGHITAAWGRPGNGIHALQVEINRGLYMNELTFRRSQGFALLERLLTAALKRFFAALPRIAIPSRMAAE
jgi:N-formylglutamate amidohydrolase